MGRSGGTSRDDRGSSAPGSRAAWSLGFALVVVAIGAAAWTALRSGSGNGMPPVNVAGDGAAASLSSTPGDGERVRLDGYAGSRRERAPGDADPGTDSHAPADGRNRRERAVVQLSDGSPVRWDLTHELAYAREDNRRDFARRVAAAPVFPEVLQWLLRASGSPASLPTERDATQAPVPVDVAVLADVLDEALRCAVQPSTRQALIFHLAIGLPPGLAAPRLAALRTSGDAEDRADALFAAAFAGAPGAVDELEDYVRRAVSVTMPEVAYQSSLRRLERENRRDVLRSYRAIEVLDQAPYFHMDTYDAYPSAARDLPRRIPTAAAREPLPAATEQRVLEAWLTHYPNHSGSDDMAFRIARLRHDEGDLRGAVDWASRASLMPDGDMRNAALSLVLEILESAPPNAPIVREPLDPSAVERNRELLKYVSIRRAAQDGTFADGIAAWAAEASVRPDSLLARAYREAWCAEPSPALDSGTPLPIHDSLRQRGSTEEARVPDAVPVHALPAAKVQRATADSAVRLDLARLRRQLRAWHTLDELERRMSQQEGDERLETQYRMAAVWYHERDVLYPVYADHSVYSSGRPRFRFTAIDRLPRWAQAVYRDAFWWGDDPPGDRERRSQVAHAWRMRVDSGARATALFRELLAADPTHPLADDALYSLGVQSVRDANRARYDRDVPDCLRTAVDAFETLVRTEPDSPFAQSAADAAAYWRRTRKELF